MEFLNPLALLAMAAVAVPLLLHLFNLRRPKTVDFSSLAFVKELQKSAVQRVKIKEWLLLALRMLAIACLVAAFARPTLTGSLAGVGQAVRTAHAVVVDNSLSMTLRDADGAYLDQARRRAEGILSTVESDDEVLLWPTARTGASRPTLAGSPAPARDALGALTPAAGTVPLARALADAAAELEGSTAPRKVVYAVTDAQASTLGDSLAAPLPEGVAATLVPVGSRTPTNVAVTGVEVVSRIAEVGQPVRVEATLVHYGTEPLPGTVASMYLQGERVAQATATLEPNVPTTVTFTATPQSRGWLEGTVELEDDDFPADDVRHFTLHVPRERRVLMVRGTGQNTEYVDLALSSDMVADRIAFRTTRIAEADLPATELGPYDAVLLVGPQTLSSGEVSSLARYVNRGGGLLLFPSTSARPDDYNALFQALGGGRFRGFSGEAGSRQPIAAFDRVDLEHPLFEGVFDRSGRQDETTVESPEVYYAMNYAPGGGDGQTLISLSNGFPFLQEIRHGSGVGLVAATAPAPAWSDLPVRGLFIPLLYRSVYYLSAGTSVAGEQITAGTAGELRITGVAPGTPLRMVGPDGVERTPDRRSLFGATLLEIGADLHTLGVYDVLAGEERVRRVAVNLDARESDLQRAAPEDAVATLQEATGRPVQLLDATGAPGAVAEALQTQRTGTEIWNVFLLLALAFLVSEMLVASQWRPETTAA